jgi:hypothetical protein
VHNRAALVKTDIIHKSFHKINTSTVLGQPAFGSGGIRYCIGVKACSLVPDGDRDFSVCVAATLYVNTLAGVLTVAVDHSIRKGFTDGRLDIDLASIPRSKVQNEPHQSIYEWRDDPDLTRERLP